MSDGDRYAAYLAQINAVLPKTAERCFAQDSRVGQAALYSLSAGGKRVRAVLCLAVCEMLHGDTQTALAYACGVEMLHCYSLIHDDLPCMDNDDYRRGKPSCHKAYGEATALLAGDALLTAAFEVLSGAPGSPARNAQAVAALSRAAGGRGMVRGQELDLYFETRPASGEQLREVHRNKTGMLIDAAAALGAIAAGASPQQREAVSRYAFAVGLVFQIIDDILDVTSSLEALGKPVGSDKSNGKTTFVTLYGIEESRRMARQLTQEACGALNGAFGADAAFLVQFAQSLLERQQ